MMRPSTNLTAILILALFTIAPAWAERGNDSDRKSKNGKTEGQIDGVAVVVEYGRPNVNGREIWGALVPWDKVWRTGANEATTISFDQDVTVAGEALAAGTYGLFTVPGKSEWTLIFNRMADQWGSSKYDKAQDALRITATSKSHGMVESLDFVIESNDLVLRWEKLALAVPIQKAP